jgi:trafficking protein particle complex subunit 8
MRAYSTRKGVRNVLKSWWRKPGTNPGSSGVNGSSGESQYGPSSGGLAAATPSSGGYSTGDRYNSDSYAVQYPHDSIQSCIRLLADSTFIMQDYDTAYSMYRMARDDFKVNVHMFNQLNSRFLKYVTVCLCHTTVVIVKGIGQKQK